MMNKTKNRNMGDESNEITVDELKDVLDGDYKITTTEIKDGDIIIVKSDNILSDHAILGIKNMIRRKFIEEFPNIKIIVLDKDIDLQILRKVD